MSNEQITVPTTPATTPPGNSIGTMQQYPTTQGYDASRQVYSASAGQQTSPYGNHMRYPQYPKTEMAPPAPRDGEQADIKSHELAGQAGAQDDADHEQGEYTHTSAPYGASRAYGYEASSHAGIQNEPQHLSPELSSSPSHPNGSGRATPRTTTTSQAQWGAYGTPQQRAPASNVYNVMSDARGPAVNGTPEGAYPPTAYPSQAYAATNGATSNKRGRDDDDDYRPDSRGDVESLKRRKTENLGGAVGASPFEQGLQRTKTAAAAMTQRLA